MDNPLSDNHNSLVSLVVLNYNKCNDLRRNLAQLRNLTYPRYEVIVVDNASTDDSTDLVCAEFPEVELIVSPVNGGVSKGRNLGFRRARGDYIVYLDDDSVAPVDVCEKVIEKFEQYPNVGSLAFLVQHMPDGRYQNEATTDILGNYHGAGHAFRREALEKIDYLDEHLFFGAEEIDSCLRLREAGYMTRYAPEIVVEHYSRTYAGAEFGTRTAASFASFNWFYWRHFPARWALLFTAHRSLASMRFSVRRGRIWPIFSGWAWFLRGLPRVWRQRRVASRETIAFYVSPDLEPPLSGLWKLIRRGRQR